MLSKTGLLKRFFSNGKNQEYSELDKWIANTLDIPIGRLSVNRYYIKDGFWFCHEHFYLEHRTTVDNISETNRLLNTRKIRSATSEEIEYFG